MVAKTNKTETYKTDDRCLSSPSFFLFFIPYLLIFKSIILKNKIGKTIIKMEIFINTHPFSPYTLFELLWNMGERLSNDTYQ